jgi:hypothetical protein
MAVAAPARRSAPAAPPRPPRAPAKGGAAQPAKRAARAQPASPVKPAPARKRPLRPTRGRPKAAAGTAAPARKAPARKAPARKAPARKSATTAQRAVAGGQLIPLAVGRTAVAVSQLPDSGLVVRLTRGRAWIGLLGVLLVGIVALNVVTLSFAASSGKIDEEITALEQDSSILRGRDAKSSGIGAVRNAAGPLGLAMPSSDEIHFVDAGHGDVATAAARLAAAGG